MMGFGWLLLVCFVRFALFDARFNIAIYFGLEEEGRALKTRGKALNGRSK